MFGFLMHICNKLPLSKHQLLFFTVVKPSSVRERGCCFIYQIIQPESFIRSILDISSFKNDHNKEAVGQPVPTFNFPSN